MKVYTKVVMDVKSGEILEEESYEYSGPIAEAKSVGTLEHSIPGVTQAVQKLKTQGPGGTGGNSFANKYPPAGRPAPPRPMPGGNQFPGAGRPAPPRPMPPSTTATAGPGVLAKPAGTVGGPTPITTGPQHVGDRMKQAGWNDQTWAAASPDQRKAAMTAGWGKEMPGGITPPNKQLNPVGGPTGAMSPLPAPASSGVAQRIVAGQLPGQMQKAQASKSLGAGGYGQGPVNRRSNY